MVNDNTESKVREWALRPRNGDPLSPADVVELVLAVDDDGNARHAQTMDELGDLQDRLASVEALQNKHWEWTEREPLPRLRACEHAIVELQKIPAEHDEKHAEHLALEHVHARRRGGDAPEDDWSEQRAEPVVKRYTREQVVVAVIMAIVIVATNAAVTWIIIRALENATGHGG